MAMDFDPNELGKKHDWATYVPSRYPHFKLHDQRGGALNSCTNGRGEFILYKWENGRWEEKVRHEKPFNKVCHICNKGSQNNWDWYPKPKWINKGQDIPDIVFLCSEHERCQ